MVLFGMNKFNIIKMSNSVRWAFNFENWHPTESQWMLASSCIQAEEKERIGRFVFKKDAKASLIGRLLMRKFVADNTSIDYDKIIFDRDARGKPFLVNEGGENLSFSVSHQGSYVVLAGQTNSLTVGVDIMPTVYQGGKDLDDFFRLMYKSFSPTEWETIKGYNCASDESKMLMFNRFWALKESYVKATGTGIVIDLRTIEFFVNTKKLTSDGFVCDTVLYVDRVRQPDWYFQEMLLDPSHVVAIATNTSTQAGVGSNKFVILNFAELVEGCKPVLPEDHEYCGKFFKKDERPY